MSERCFVCGRPLSKSHAVVYCNDDQAPLVGLDCRAKVIGMGTLGYDTSDEGREGPRVWAFKHWTPSARNETN